MAVLEDDGAEEEEGLLAAEEGIRVVAEGPRAASSVSGGLRARLAAAWRRPLVQRGHAAPYWLKHHAVPNDDEEQCVRQLRQLASVSFQKEEPTHNRALRRLFAAVRSPAEAAALPETIKDPRWKEMGFQAEDPRTDFRGGGLLALQNLCYLAEEFPEEMGLMIKEAGPSSPNSEYLFAAACVNISHMLVLLLGLNSTPSMSPVRAMPSPAHLKELCKGLGEGGLQRRRSPDHAAGGPRGALRQHRDEAPRRVESCLQKETRGNTPDFGEALGSTALAAEHLLSSLSRAASDTPARALFSSIDSVDTQSLATVGSIRLARWRSG
eukprot:CAMPEP_0115164112 /NCGR_PEP_ID=MMETSP0227-20121206/72859_1 /TAXON_ID=89957 /ORGANISM="Polarella glacialis, Strain CCMP 1383" /LENGTH=323 /DNA_ID=CAMNT_0002576443 /DNA_START=66 /DNA_END=1035 /DNA_ORIENTATION=+